MGSLPHYPWDFMTCYGAAMTGIVAMGCTFLRPKVFLVTETVSTKSIPTMITGEQTDRATEVANCFISCLAELLLVMPQQMPMQLELVVLFKVIRETTESRNLRL
jgi:hypothetical protein